LGRGREGMERKGRRGRGEGTGGEGKGKVGPPSKNPGYGPASWCVDVQFERLLVF